MGKVGYYTLRLFLVGVAGFGVAFALRNTWGVVLGQAAICGGLLLTVWGGVRRFPPESD